MQICSKAPSAVVAMPIPLDEHFPVHAPYLDHLHYSGQHPAEYLHYHFSWELGICRQGSGIFYIGSRVFRYAEGDVSVIAPRVVHIAQSNAEALSGWQFLDVDLGRVLSGVTEDGEKLAQSHFSGIIHPEQGTAFRTILREILSELKDPQPHSRDLIRMKLAEFSIRLDRLTDHPTSRVVVPDHLNEISPAVLHIVNHYAEPMTLNSLAEMCSMSVSSFRRAFLRAMRTSPFEYLYHIRIQTAANLLKTTALPVTEVAARVGYGTLSSFNRHFRRIMKASPRAVRAEAQTAVPPG